MVGPQVGQDLREKALFAMFYALLFITVYISGRFELKWAKSGIVAAAIMGAVYLLSLFHVSVPFLMLAALIVSLVIFWFFEFKYAMGAIVALIHDVTITMGIFSIFDKEFTLPIVAALLTIIGYSLNDTIIVFDRIRENLRKYHKEPLTTILNKSINETLSRTILTSADHPGGRRRPVCPWRRNHPRFLLCPLGRSPGRHLFVNLCGQPHPAGMADPEKIDVFSSTLVRPEKRARGRQSVVSTAGGAVRIARSRALRRRSCIAGGPRGHRPSGRNHTTSPGSGCG